jgi:hypothetical protein
MPTAGLRALLRLPEVPAPGVESYRRERLANLALPPGFALMEGGFVGVIADKIFRAHPWLLALIIAAPMFGTLSSVMWARLAQRVRTVPLLAAMLGAYALLVAAVAIIPETRAGGFLLAGAMVGCRLLIGGFVTVRSTIWTLNYPAGVRGRVTSRLTLLAVLVMTVVSLLGSRLLDADPGHFRWLYALAAAASVLGAALYARVRVPGEDDLRVLVEAEAAREGRSRRPGVWSVLREDPLFARYMGWQFLLGVSNMMIEAPLLYLVSRELGAGYAASVALTLVLPLGLSVLTMPFFAAWLDRVHIARFRAWHSWLWVLSQALTFAGALASSLALLAVARSTLGLARSGGQLAWQIGHNDFARPERAGLYMGVHATLTGVRGIFAPFLGMALYLGWGAVTLPGVGTVIPAFAGLGGGVMLLAAALSAIATLGFASLHRRIARSR